ncbi:AAA family ATPase [Candidatus Desantisbacteria bacterium CG_4_10_14_0_8_um_filter_48_22]|uniref:AAA family ATPase n=1 Tax=Candidatus Desantisbacteria bacterium CG_4_10_14_0_8_um_filter_48_22 TaxID=1974543 RepID=A0A2M7S7Y2_9BACT|nr:MAG: AAA family ATPase [Candidatus Desantisbacteria bacterium CG1_02_49_89]PIZ15589.1 MAG: AAA family ATPase [Candidatus Desantisbacteria bacterium CG_4_10_14_0_8_um_filter_48_22]
MEKLLYRYNPWWEAKYQPEGIERPFFLGKMEKHFSSKAVIFLTGLRRIGKTTLMKLFIKKLLDSKGIDPKHIFYVSLDDYLILKKSILEIIEEYRKINKLGFQEKVFIFLDEIAYQNDFEIQLKNLHDSQNLKIYASSSSASILKSRKSFLTGRNYIIEVLPLDFEEYLNFKRVKINKADSHLVERYFEEYLGTGGLPEYVLHGQTDYIKDLVDDIIYKDIAAVHNIRNIQVLKDYFILLMERAGKKASINKIARILNISPDTSKRFLQMFIDSYLIYSVQRKGKTNEAMLSPRKIYAADLGIRVFFTGFRDKGSLFENYVFLKIKDLNPRYIYENELEIDFFTEDKKLIEVKYETELSGKQLAFFSSLEAKKRFVIRSVSDLNKLVATA